MNSKYICAHFYQQGRLLFRSLQFLIFFSQNSTVSDAQTNNREKIRKLPWSAQGLFQPSSFLKYSDILLVMGTGDHYCHLVGESQGSQCPKKYMAISHNVLSKMSTETIWVKRANNNKTKEMASQ